MATRGMRWAVAAVALGAAPVLAGCAPSEYRYVTNAATNTYLKVPRDWAKFDQDQLALAEARIVKESGGDPPSDLDRQLEKLIQWRVGFDGDGKPSALHVAGLSAKPVVDIRVRRLMARERDQVNQAALRNLLVPYDELMQQEAQREAAASPTDPISTDFQPLREDELNLGKGLRGVRLTFKIRGTETSYVIDQTALVDGSNSRLWVLVVRAAEPEYLAQRDRIEEIVKSFTVKQKG